ncbi:thiopurine S-methyltransferase [Fodinibius halophilus]|uniref:Thiopurine S-methyltransferase n=1 Tax=Fodinibius halophilus TaxID=1736908 RepID=A0A6M1T323_9BACT|nr:thiopurine S-methyltransferase [Fodinibius halophilus]NGP88457.1 thiopurine S-methyltransferase [Fodinibius halophilus]
MKKRFWHQRWETNHIAFHKSNANLLLVTHFNKLSLAKGQRVFVPLCGKTVDISWLLEKGYHVAGIELSQLAVKQLFEELKMKPAISTVGDIERYSAKHIDIFVGDIFDLTGKILGRVDAIYNRAALVALPKKMQNRYTAHLINITNNAPQLLICYEYDQQLMEGPPFSISSDEIDQHYADSYEITLLVRSNVPGGLKGKCAAEEQVWLLK